MASSRQWARSTRGTDRSCDAVVERTPGRWSVSSSIRLSSTTLRISPATRYPRTLDADLAALRAEEADFLLLPRAEDLYPDCYRYRVTEVEQSAALEGAHRPGHFDGVLTVVLKLLQIAQPERAYFGEKDWQQLTLVRGMADALFLPATIVGCETAREADGLALSSRNRHLAPAERARAPLFYQALMRAPSAGDAARELSAAGFAVDYVEDREGRRLGAVRLGGVRLIDNVRLGG